MVQIIKKYFFVLFLFVICGCSSYEKNGVYNTLNVKNINNDQYNYFQLNFNNLGRSVYFYLPQEVQYGVGGGYKIIIFILPIFILPNVQFNKNNKNFYIKNYIADQKVDEFKISLKINEKLYNSFYNKEKGQYIFPLKIKDVKKGTLIIEYKGEVKEVEFEYGFKWFYYH